jgi:hypothetical protein
MKKNKLTSKVTLMITLGTFLVGTAKAQTTTLGTGAGIGGTTNVNIGKDAGKVNTAAANTFVGYEAGKVNTTGYQNTCVGASAGIGLTTGWGNIFLGNGAGYSNTTGYTNTFIGINAGYSNLGGPWNVFIGKDAGRNNKNAGGNCFIGFESGYNNNIGAAATGGGYQNTAFGNKSLFSNTTGINNLAFGYAAGYSKTSGDANVFIGFGAGGGNLTGSGNVFIGNASGSTELGSNKLYIANSNTTTPLIYGEFDNKKLVFNGKLGINTSTFPATVGTANVSTYGLFVKGGILTEEVRVRTGWADYVFNDNYKLMPLNEVETYITDNNHLPNVPTATEVETEGLSLGEMAKIQQEKIEELTIYIINLNKKLEAQEARINALQQATNK